MSIKIIPQLDKHSLEIIKKSISSSIVKVGGVAVSLFVSIFLGRNLGPEGLGVIDLSNRIVNIILIFTVFGMNQVLVKNIAIFYSNGDNSSILDYISSSLRFTGFIALFFAVCLYLGSSFICEEILRIPQLIIPLRVCSLVIIPQTFSRIFASGLNGIGKIWQSNLVNESLSAWTVGFGLIACKLFNVSFDVEVVAIVYALARSLTFIVIFIYWRSVFKFRGNKKFIIGSIIKSASILLFVQGTNIIASNCDAVMLGWIADASEVGIYGVALKLATFMMFFLQVSNSAISPKLASLFAQGKIEDIQVMVKKVTLGLLGIAILFLVGFVLLGHLLLDLWGDASFQEAYIVLIILCAGQFINMSTGCAGLILIMCGFERIHGYISFACVLLNLILNYFLIRDYGAVGAAVATSFIVILENLLKVYFAKNQTGILTLPI